MSPPILNPIGEDKIYVKASQSGPAEYDESEDFAFFLIKRQVSVKFVSDDKNSPAKSFELPCMEDESFLMGYEVNWKSRVSLELVGDMLYEGNFIPFNIDRSMWRERHLNGTIHDEAKSCCSSFNRRSLLEKIRDFLLSMKFQEHNEGKNILPVKLEIVKVVTVRDEELKNWNLYFHDQERCNPDFARDLQEAVRVLIGKTREDLICCEINKS